MNYYEHHLGDYLRDTAHLSMIEDGAYRRLIDAYYIRQQPLPGELRDVYRLVRAASKQDKEAVDVVLNEFFTLTDEGYRHARCDAEIERFHEGDVDRDAKRENAKERQRRTRERRRELFEALRSHDIVPAYDTPTHELQAQLSRVTSQPVTPPVTRDATATQHQHQPQTPVTPSLRSGGARGTRLSPDWMPEVFDDWTQGPELAKFRDYWAAQPGSKGVKADWNATWRNWIRRASEYAESRGNRRESPAKPTSAVERVRQACGLDDDGWPLGPDDGDLRPQVDQQLRDEADGRVVEAPFRVVSG